MVRQGSIQHFIDEVTHRDQIFNEELDEVQRLCTEHPTPYQFARFGTPLTFSSDNPDEVLREIAGYFAAAYKLPEARVLRCVQRLYDFDVSEGSWHNPKSDPTFSTYITSLFTEMSQRTTPLAALALCETEDLTAYRRRVLMAQKLTSSLMPLYTLDELGGLLSEFVEHLECNRDSLLDTGHAKMFFGRSRWLDLYLNKLYFTKLAQMPDVVAPASVGQPSDFSGGIDWRRLGDRTTRRGPELWELFGKINYRCETASPPCNYVWFHHSVNGFTQCTYEEAESLSWITCDEQERLTSLRPAVLKLKSAIFCQLADSIRKRDQETVWADCLALVTRDLIAADAEFLLRMDEYYAGFDVRAPGDQRTPRPPLSPGGLTNLLELVGHVEKELVVGTMRRTRGCLDGAMTHDHLQRPRFISELNRSQREKLAELPPLNPYLDLVALGKQDEIRSGVDLCVQLDAEEPAFWAMFRRRVEEALATEFLIDVGVRIPQQYAPLLQPRLQDFADQWMVSRATSPSDKKEGQNLFRRRGEGWEIQFKTTNRNFFPQMDGLFYLHVLLDKSERGYSPQQLYAEKTLSESPNRHSHAADDVESTTLLANGGEFLDDRAREDYRQRISEIDDELRQAERNRDRTQLDELIGDKEFILSQLSQATGLFGKKKQMSPEGKKARDRVRNAIDRAIEKIGKWDSTLAGHLHKSLEFKDLVAYRPEEPTPWLT